VKIKLEKTEHLVMKKNRNIHLQQRLWRGNIEILKTERYKKYGGSRIIEHTRNVMRINYVGIIQFAVHVGRKTDAFNFFRRKKYLQTDVF
jgi:hypothetical protein